MLVTLPFEVTHTFANGTSVVYPIGSVINIDKFPEIAKKLKKYQAAQNRSPADKMIRTDFQKKDIDGS